MRAVSQATRAGRAAGYLVVLAVCAVALTACGDVGRFEPGIGFNERTEQTDVFNMAIVTDGQGHGRVVGTMFNNTDTQTRLMNVTVESERSPIDVSLPDGPVVLPPNQPVNLARLAAVSASTPNDNKFPVGFLVPMTLKIDGEQSVNLQVPVETNTGPYSEIEVTKPPDGDVSPG